MGLRILLDLPTKHMTELHSYNAAELLLNIVNRVTAKTLVGEPLCQNTKWLQTSLDITVNTGLLSLTLRPYPSLLRPLISPLISARRNLDRAYSIAQELLSIPINDRKQRDENVDILQWLIDSYKDTKLNVPFLTNQMLFVAIAATRSTATSIVHTIYDLLAFPKYQASLRQQIKEALAECEGWSLAAFQKMKRLDSFVKES